MFNASYIDDPVLNDYRDQMMAAYPDEDAVDDIHAEMMPYLLEQCYVLNVAGHYTYRFWWPWLKNYSGEGAVGYYGGGVKLDAICLDRPGSQRRDGARRLDGFAFQGGLPTPSFSVRGKRDQFLKYGLSNNF